MDASSRCALFASDIRSDVSAVSGFFCVVVEVRLVRRLETDGMGSCRLVYNACAATSAIVGSASVTVNMGSANVRHYRQVAIVYAG